MFIVSFKFKSIKLIFSLLTAIIVAILLFWIVTTIVIERTSDVFEPKQNFNFSDIRTNEDRVEFLKQFGWEVSPQPIEIVEVIIPKEFDDVYKEYNKIQSELGLDLGKYKGKRVKRYTYKVFNHPQVSDAEVRANILVYKDEVIAGDIMTTSIEGFMHSLLYSSEFGVQSSESRTE